METDAERAGREAGESGEGLPPKPPIADMPPEHGLELSDEELDAIEEDVPEHEFMDEEQADADDSVDNAEAEEEPYDSTELPAPDED